MAGARHAPAAFLFEELGTEQAKLEVTRVIHSPPVTHLRYRVVK